jgi:hypothetical protein
MAKTANTTERGASRREWVALSLPKDHQLAELLHSANGKFARELGVLGTGADPHSGAATTVRLPAGEAPAVAEDLRRLLERARETGNPAADALAEVLTQI